MPTYWHLEEQRKEPSPVPFRRLVELVRAGEVMEDDLVRADWSHEWRRADEVPGLFYMAWRAEAQVGETGAAAKTVEDGAAGDDEETAGSGIGEDAAEENALRCRQRPRWVERLLMVRWRRGSEATGASRSDVDESLSEAEESVASSQGSNSADIPQETQGVGAGSGVEAETGAELGAGEVPAGAGTADLPRNGGYSEDVWSSVVGAAVDAVDSRSKGQQARRGRLARLGGGLAALLSGVASRDLLRHGFRFGCALVGANLAGYWVMNRSHWEALRFPSRAEGYTFPVFGTCTPGEYFFLLADLMLAAGVAAYFGARWLEQRADDA